MSEVVIATQDGRVLTLTMNRPDALNAIDSESARALRRAFEQAVKDTAVGCIVLTGAGRAFSAGADLRELSSRHERGERELGQDLRENYAPLIRAIRTCPKPVVAAINGTAAGAGLSLALACDLRVIASDAQLIVVFVRVGLVPDAGSLFFLTRMLGYGKAMELALTGNPVSAAEAHRLGLVSAVAAPGELLSTVTELASGLSAGPAEAYALIKRGMERALSLDLEQALELEAHLQSLAGRTADHQEAVRAFLDKRKPVFRGAE
ncbi:MAG: enoyl-CoA hydratase [Chloroflexi bacterium]|nr:MAG: enoyl-CoA hydratase [Chloroflexota bacterium]